MLVYTNCLGNVVLLISCASLLYFLCFREDIFAFFVAGGRGCLNLVSSFLLWQDPHGVYAICNVAVLLENSANVRKKHRNYFTRFLFGSFYLISISFGLGE